MICGSCHSEFETQPAIVHRFAGDPGVPICDVCEERLKNIGVLILEENPYILPRSGESFHEAMARVIEALKVK